jgi:hypothetical protein
LKKRLQIADGRLNLHCLTIVLPSVIPYAWPAGRYAQTKAAPVSLFSFVNRHS